MAKSDLSLPEGIMWAPFAGKQTEFCAASEFEVLFGGAKGPGKTDSLLFTGLRQIHKPRYKALLLRKSFPDLREIVARSRMIFPFMGGEFNQNQMTWTFPSGAQFEFGFCLTMEDAQRYHGREFAYIGYDEIGHLPEEAVWEQLMAECRCPDPTVIRMMRCSANPIGPGVPWLKRRFLDPCGFDGARIHRYYLDIGGGRKVEMARRFVPARVIDNPVYYEDELYMAQLHSLPERRRRLLLYGDWSAAEGAALDELSREKHWIERFEPPENWTRVAAFDWGYSHPFCFILAAVDPDGTVWVIDSVHGRRLRDDEIVDRIRDSLGADRVSRFAWAGQDCWNEIKARLENTPTTAETFARKGLPLQKANQSRIQGLNNMRNYFAWRGLGPDGGDGEPKIKIMATPANDILWKCLEEMVPDPDNPEDVLKKNADEEGRGGDDPYDCLRYLLASRPLRGRQPDQEKIDPKHYDTAYEHHIKQLQRPPSVRGF